MVVALRTDTEEKVMPGSAAVTVAPGRKPLPVSFTATPSAP